VDDTTAVAMYESSVSTAAMAAVDLRVVFSSTL
jgi:hypothetical protein